THSTLSAPSTTTMPPLSLHDALPIYDQTLHHADLQLGGIGHHFHRPGRVEYHFHIHLLDGRYDLQAAAHIIHQDIAHAAARRSRSEEHTSELQSRFDLVCRLLLEKKK